MTLIAGEGFLVTARPTGFDGAVLTPTDEIDVKLWIAAPGADEGDFIVTNQAMEWDATMSFTDRGVTLVGWWWFLWDTADKASGTYRGKAVAIGPDGIKSFEQPTRIRLAADKLPT